MSVCASVPSALVSVIARRLPGAIVQQRGTGFDAGLLTYLLIAKFHYTDTDTDTDFLRRNSVGSVRVRFAAKKSVSV